jgi:hypothetical protein
MNVFWLIAIIAMFIILVVIGYIGFVLLGIDAKVKGDRRYY